MNALTNFLNSVANGMVVLLLLAFLTFFGTIAFVVYANAGGWAAMGFIAFVLLGTWAMHWQERWQASRRICE